MKSGSDVQITKASGEQVPFSEEKLRQSLERAGATEMHFESQKKAWLLEKGVVLCRKVPENEDLLREQGVSGNRLAKIINECEELVNEPDVPRE